MFPRETQMLHLINGKLKRRECDGNFTALTSRSSHVAPGNKRPRTAGSIVARDNISAKS